MPQVTLLTLIIFYSIIYPIIHSRPDFFPVFFQISVAPLGLQSDAISERKMKFKKDSAIIMTVVFPKIGQGPYSEVAAIFYFFFFFIVNSCIIQTTENNTNSIDSDVREYLSLLSVIAWTSY